MNNTHYETNTSLHVSSLYRKWSFEYIYIGWYDKSDLKVIGLFAYRYVHQQPILQMISWLNLCGLIIFAYLYMVVCQHFF